MFVGVGAAHIHVCSQAEAKAPCIVFIDELDALGKVRVQARSAAMRSASNAQSTVSPRWTLRFRRASSSWAHQPPRSARPGAPPAWAVRPALLVDKPDVSREDPAHSRQGREDGANVELKIVAAQPPAPIWRIWSTKRRCSRRAAQDRGRDEGLRVGDRSAGRRAREEAGDEPEGTRDGRVLSRATRLSPR